MLTSRSNDEQFVGVDGATLCVETYGDARYPAIILIDGAAASMLWWDARLCNRLAAAHRFVIRYDNRDTGRSTAYPPGHPGYSFTDLALDALAILDHFGVRRAHVVCRSMAGGVGLILAVDHPGRVATLTLVSTSTGAEDLPPPSAELRTRTPARPDFTDRAAVVEFVVASTRAYSGGSPYFDEAAQRALVERDVARARNIESSWTNHYLLDFAGPTNGSWRDIVAPSLVVHGDHDPVFPPAHARALRDAIRESRLLMLSGAGHDLPHQLWDPFIGALLEHTAGDAS